MRSERNNPIDLTPSDYRYWDFQIENAKSRYMKSIKK